MNPVVLVCFLVWFGGQSWLFISYILLPTLPTFLYHIFYHFVCYIFYHFFYNIFYIFFIIFKIAKIKTLTSFLTPLFYPFFKTFFFSESRYFSLFLDWNRWAELAFYFLYIVANSAHFLILKRFDASVFIDRLIRIKYFE